MKVMAESIISFAKQIVVEMVKINDTARQIEECIIRIVGG